MAFYNYNKDFQIEKIRHNNLDELRIRWWEYKIISKLPDEKVKEFCTNELVPIHQEKDKNNPFALELVKFENTTNIENSTFGNMYHYIVKKETTS